MDELNDTLESAETVEVPSVRDDLEAAMTEYAAREKTDEVVVEETVEAKAERDEQGRFKAKAAEVVETAAPVTTDTVLGAVATEPSSGAPQHWSAADKAMIAALPADKQAVVVDRIKQMEAGFTPKLQEAAELKRTWGEVESFLAPHAEDIQKRGLTMPSMVKAWAQVEKDLQSDPVGTVQRIAQAYGVDIAKIASGELQPQPAVVIPPALQQKIDWLEGQAKERVASEQKAQLDSAVTQIKTFAEAKTDAGQLAHPFYAEVEGQMLSLAAADRAAGKVPVLQDLYDRAIWADPTVRQKQIAAMKQADQAKATADAKAKSLQARKAGSSVSGSPVNGSAARVAKTGGSLRETILAAQHEVDAA